MPTRKLDSEQIKIFLNQLSEKNWVKGTEKRWWPKFVFHYTDIANAISILRDGCIYSRQHAERSGKLVTSSGSSSILASTNSEIKDCVRLYFRPKTPTQYNAEGIQSKISLAKSQFSDAHCPIPIFFLFDSSDILTRNDSWFSDGGLGSNKANKNLRTSDELQSLPWKKIYHLGSYNRNKPSQNDITFRRNAEIVVPKKLELDSLKYIYCRSEAEKETLLYLLPQTVRNKFQNKIVATSRSNLYFRRHTFIQSVRLTTRTIDLNFSPESQSPGPFHLRIEVLFNNQKIIFDREVQKLNKRRTFMFKPEALDYKITVRIDDYLTYANSFQEYDIPF